MKRLVFEQSQGTRVARFENRSLLPVSAACVVANAMRERLAELCGRDVDVRLFPPVIPQREGWAAILEGARLYVVRGASNDAAIVLRPYDARTLAALLFGETGAGTERELSRLEKEITRRAVGAVSSTLAPVCGETRIDEEAQGIGAVTYFELHVVQPLRLCIGIALSREPASGAAPSLRADALHPARVTLTAELPLAPLCTGAIAALRAGDIIDARVEAALLRANGAAIGTCRCGVRSRRYAVALA